MKIFIAFLIALCPFAAMAGDAAVFSEMGFSEDGKYYVFGEYGRTDKASDASRSFCGWAEIYAVDVEANAFVNGGVFRTAAAAKTRGKSGIEVYDTLSAKSRAVISKYNCTKPTADRVLYICDSPSKTGDEKIEFRDFTRLLGTLSGDGAGKSGDNTPAYRVHINQSVKGKGMEASSSFHIVLEKIGADGKAIASQIVGSPNIVRKGVTGYKIERISCNKERDALVFVVAKTMEDDTGVLIRYMVETAKIHL